MYWIDGVADAPLAPDDRGLAYGDGIFTTMALVEGRIELLDYHLGRMQRDAERLVLKWPGTRLLARELATAVDAATSRRHVVKLIVTRGGGGRGYAPPSPPHSRRIVSLHPWPDSHDQRYLDGITLHSCSTPLPASPRLAGVKHLNRLEQVLARGEWSDPAIADGVMYDDCGLVIEGVSGNLFLVENGRLVTPQLDRCGVAGVMRRAVIEVATTEGLGVASEPVSSGRLLAAEELFFTNAIATIWPVVRMAHRHWPVGELTRHLQRALASRYGLIRCGQAAGEPG